MHEVRVSAPVGTGETVAHLALAAGIKSVSVYEVLTYSIHDQPQHRPRQIISVETSTPNAKKFVDAIFAAPWFDRQQYSITTRELRSIFSSEPVLEITRPMIEPALDVLEDLWQMCHVTPSYIGRATGAALVLAYGMFKNSPISMVVAALFLPFLSQVLALGYGLWVGDWKLARQGTWALCTSIVVSIAAGALVATLNKGPLEFTDFQRPLVAFGISSVIGITAGLASADDTGRRYLIGVAAAVQYAVFPVWFGTCLVLGFPNSAVVMDRVGTFAINLVTITITAAVVYAFTGMRKEEAGKFRSKIKDSYSS